MSAARGRASVRYGHDANAAARPDLLPLLDVIFSILACFAFVVALSELPTGALRVALPGVSEQAVAVEAPLPALIVSYDAEGRVQIDGDELELDQLSDALRAALAVEPGRPLRLRGDRDARLELTARVLAAAQLAGTTQVQIAVRGERSDS